MISDKTPSGVFFIREGSESMTWEIFLGIVAVFSFVVTAVKTILPLTNAVAVLTAQVGKLEQTMKDVESDKKEAHRRIWQHNDEQDERLERHEQRLHDLDGK